MEREGPASARRAPRARSASPRSTGRATRGSSDGSSEPSQSMKQNTSVHAVSRPAWQAAPKPRHGSWITRAPSRPAISAEPSREPLSTTSGRNPGRHPGEHPRECGGLVENRKHQVHHWPRTVRREITDCERLAPAGRRTCRPHLGCCRWRPPPVRFGSPAAVPTCGSLQAWPRSPPRRWPSAGSPARAASGWAPGSRRSLLTGGRSCDRARFPPSCCSPAAWLPRRG